MDIVELARLVGTGVLADSLVVFYELSDDIAVLIAQSSPGVNQ